jgi:hypothetical protein
MMLRSMMAVYKRLFKKLRGAVKNVKDKILEALYFFKSLRLNIKKLSAL